VCPTVRELAPEGSTYYIARRGKKITKSGLFTGRFGAAGPVLRTRTAERRQTRYLFCFYRLFAIGNALFRPICHGNHPSPIHFRHPAMTPGRGVAAFVLYDGVQQKPL
jgi:hypothetical protein